MVSCRVLPMICSGPSIFAVGRVSMNERQKAMIAELEAYIVQHHSGGKIADGEVYTNGRNKMSFVDAGGNPFKMAPETVKAGHWSPYEAGVVRDPAYQTATLAAYIAEHHPGGNIAEGSFYVSAHVKMVFVDASNTFMASPNNVKKGSWSPYEAGKVRDHDYHMRILADIVARRGGRIADGSRYTHSMTKMSIVDALGHTFQMAPSDLKAGKWSPYEADRVRDPAWHMQILENMAKSRGGNIADGSVYAGAFVKMAFIDSAGNHFSMTPAGVKSGKWSPHERHVAEHVCRQAIEHLLGALFPSRWDVAKRPDGGRLQFDGFNKDLRVAFEYQGFWHEVSDVQKVRDADKRTFCKAHGILLIEVPEFPEGHRFHTALIFSLVRDAVLTAYSEQNLQPPTLLNDGFEIDLRAPRSLLTHAC